MSLTELLPHLHSLPRNEKLRAIQLLAEDLAREEPANLLEPGQSYPVWSPWDAHEAAALLLKLLEAEEGKP
jgi:hypothetical protein